jgi:hypothetical protein
MYDSGVNHIRDNIRTWENFYLTRQRLCWYFQEVSLSLRRFLTRTIFNMREYYTAWSTRGGGSRASVFDNSEVWRIPT